MLKIFRVNSWVSACVVSNLLLTLLTPLTAYGGKQLNESIAFSSCFGLGLPVNTDELRKYGSLKNIGDVFEAFALRSIGIRKYTGPIIYSSLRDRETKGGIKNVEPDGYTTLFLLIKDETTNQVIKQYSFPNSIIFDAKAVNTRMPYSYSEHQLAGYIDILSRSPAATGTLSNGQRATPRLVLLTSADAIVGENLKEFATQQGVAIYQQIVCTNFTGIPKLTDLIMGRPINLNPNVYTSKRAKPNNFEIRSIPSSLYK
ncbi:hypothetical protein WA1_21725 [Scytonema hofmannii PCC 7110]|uniref:Uncharacterized protein n=1 Tax=Scytonema hofmannii PCC 7110 TaxID=128403 RepID=A0A139X9G4_9CYAN|nr:hypothetical protein [Scytonema hofmannii]KYC41330.1 hypothetical protein WA1_21725 [Scytonema hofmannii PCC 7110]